MIYLVFIFIYFILLFFYFWLKSGRWGADLAATSLLIAISFASIMIDIEDIYGDYGVNYENMQFIPTILYCLQWTLVLYPLHWISRLELREHLSHKTFGITMLMAIVVISGIIAVVVRAEDIRDAMIMDMADTYNEHIDTMYKGNSDGEFHLYRLFTDIFTATPFSTLCIFICFYMISFRKGPVLLRLLLLLASMIQSVIGISEAGRAAVIFWIFDLYMVYSFFYHYISRRTRIWINSAAAVLIGIVGFVFVVITISRFEDGQRDPLESLWAYAGQHPNNFSTLMVNGGNTEFTYDRELPYLYRMLNHKSFDLFDHYAGLGSSIGLLVNVFDTFGCELYLDMGWFAYTIMMLLFLFLCFYLREKWREEIPFYRVLFIVILIAFFVRGLFSWPFTGHTTSQALFLLLVVTYYLKYDFKV